MRKSGSWQAAGDKAGLLRSQGNLPPGVSTQLPCSPDTGVPGTVGTRVVWVWLLWSFTHKHFLFPLCTDAWNPGPHLGMRMAGGGGLGALTVCRRHMRSDCAARASLSAEVHLQTSAKKQRKWAQARTVLLTWGVSIRGEKAQFQGPLRSSPANKMAWGLENGRKDTARMTAFTLENSRQLFITMP